MSKLVWDDTGNRLYETGVDQGVLFVKNSSGTYENGVAWNGLTAVNESPTGGEASPIYADNIKYLNLMSDEEFAGSIEAYTYPDEFAVCDGSVAIQQGVYASAQPRKEFGFSYRTLVGNDVDGKEHGYKIHLVYNCLASPSDRSHSTVNDSPEAESLSWDFTTTPESFGPSSSYKPTAHIVIDSTKCDATKLTAFEAKLYGAQSTEPTLPSPAQVITDFTTP